jgi:peptide-methionine (R)-S-oxide reductase
LFREAEFMKPLVAALAITVAAATALLVFAPGNAPGTDTGRNAADSTRPDEKNGGDNMTDKVQKTDEQWREQLTPEQYRITRQGGTEPAFTGKYYDFDGAGVYRCVCCGNVLFDSNTKYHSGSGWPSFYAPDSDGAVESEIDRGLGMTRTEIKCSRCGAHLGHVFDDGPEPTGLRYCINSAALDFQAVDSSETKPDGE